MIDIANTVLNHVATALQTTFGANAITVTSDIMDAPAAFPCVSVVELSNTTYKRSLDVAAKEHHANVEYQIDIYTNKQAGNKTYARSIAKTIDTAMEMWKFTRTFMQPVPNIDRSIYRITMRYTAVVAAGVADDDDVIYQIYRQ